MKLKMIIEIEIITTKDVNTEQAKGICLAFFSGIKRDSEGGKIKDLSGEAEIKRVTLEEMYKNGFEI